MNEEIWNASLMCDVMCDEVWEKERKYFNRIRRVSYDRYSSGHIICGIGFSREHSVSMKYKVITLCARDFVHFFDFFSLLLSFGRR